MQKLDRTKYISGKNLGENGVRKMGSATIYFKEKIIIKKCLIITGTIFHL